MTPARRDCLVLSAILVLATVLRLVGLPGRGEWDDDQGTELLAMLAWVRDGEVPLLGPVSSLGTTHHGVAYYWILAPSAFLSDVNPVAVVATLAVVGTAGVAAVWWLGRTVGGPLAGHVAALLMAVSPSAIATSTLFVELQYRRARCCPGGGQWLARVANPATTLVVIVGGRDGSPRAWPRVGGVGGATADRVVRRRSSPTAPSGATTR